jgi:hypothetical protein
MQVQLTLAATQHETESVYEALQMHAFTRAAVDGPIVIFEKEYGESNGRFRCRIYVQVHGVDADLFHFNFGVVTHAVDSVTKDYIAHDQVFESGIVADAKAFIAHLKFIDRLLHFSQA